MSSTTTTRPKTRRRIAGERRGAVTDAAETGSSAHPVLAPEAGHSQPLAEPVPTHEEPPLPDRPAGSPEDAAGDPDRPARGVRWQPLLTVLAVAAVTAVVLAAGPLIPGVGVEAFADRQEHAATDAARRAAPVAAERAAVAILGYDHRRLGTDRDRAAGLMTDDYRRQYLRTFDGAVLEQAEKLRARVVAEVRASAVTLAEPGRAQVLVFVDQTTHSTANDQPQVALNRVMFSMVEQGGAWKVADITSY